MPVLKKVIYVRFWRQGDTEYKFRTRLLPETDPRRATLTLAHAERLERVQKRDFYRLSVRIPVALFDVPETAGDADLEARTGERIEGLLRDLSAGGATLVSRVKLAPGRLLTIDPGFQGDFSLAGIVCRVVRTETVPDGRSVNHLEFLNVSRRLQDRLIQEIQRHQIEARGIRNGEGQVEGKGSEAHKASVVGDTVGDPFKDTAGPSLHVLIKLLATITLVLAPLFI